MRKVKYAKLQGTDAFVPDVGGLGTTLPPLGKTLNLEMYDIGDKLLLIMDGHKGKRVSAFVPITNVQIAVYAEEDKPIATAAQGIKAVS